MSATDKPQNPGFDIQIDENGAVFVRKGNHVLAFWKGEKEIYEAIRELEDRIARLEVSEA